MLVSMISVHSGPTSCSRAAACTRSEGQTLGYVVNEHVAREQLRERVAGRWQRQISVHAVVAGEYGV